MLEGSRHITVVAITAEDEARVEEFAGNLFMATLATMDWPTSSSACGSGSTSRWPAPAL
jgi:hypothetical protein